MTHTQYRAQAIALVLTLLLVLAAGITLAVGTAAAQEDDPTETPTPTPGDDEGAAEDDSQGTDTATDEPTTETETASESTDDEDDQSYEFVFPGDNLRLVDSHWEGKTFVATFEAKDRPERITVTDAGRVADNNENIVVDRESFTVSTQGTTTVRFTVVEDRQVTIDDGNTLLLKGHSASVSSPDVHTLVSAAIGLLMAFLLIVEIARRTGRLSKSRVVKA